MYGATGVTVEGFEKEMKGDCELTDMIKYPLIGMHFLIGSRILFGVDGTIVLLFPQRG